VNRTSIVREVRVMRGSMKGRRASRLTERAGGGGERENAVAAAKYRDKLSEPININLMLRKQ